MRRISTHAPAGGATKAKKAMDKGKDFYSRPCGRGDDLHDEGVRRLCHFYSRPCGRGDRLFVCFYNGRRRFLLTPLREGRRSSSPARQAQIYFYSRPCGRGDAGSRQMTVIFQLISTHAPAGGATFAADTCALQLFPISTHAPAGGATASCAAGKGRGTDFYSRPCGRGDACRRAGE